MSLSTNSGNTQFGHNQKYKFGKKITWKKTNQIIIGNCQFHYYERNILKFPFVQMSNINFASGMLPSREYFSSSK